MIRHVACAADFIPLASTETVTPDPGRLIFALRQIGYSLEQALSDLIDNAVSAGARNVLIRFLWKGERILAVAIADDGNGMSPEQLLNAMRFGSADRGNHMSLGKFGLGLKLASFSHARKLTVVSRAGGDCSARRWTLEGIRRNWDCETLSSAQATELFGAPWSPLDLRKGGTIVHWDDVDKLPVSSRGLRYTLGLLHRRLELHLGLHFHRFLQQGTLRIYVDQQEHGEQEHQIRARIAPLDPFAYPYAPSEGYPRVFAVRIPDVGEIMAEGHIWPPNNELAEYRLGNRAAARQGFFFYRNDRLIQAGGWNGLVQNETEPHSSLARVRVDLPPALDSSFSLSVQKSSVIVPPGFVEAVQSAEDTEGTGFERYRQAAQTIYRNRDARALARRPTVPGRGLPASVAKAFASSVGDDAEDVRPIDMHWTKMDNADFFRLDAENSRLLLNARYRSKILLGLTPGMEDVPLLKTVLFCLLSQDLTTPKPSARRRHELARINRILAAAAELEQG